MDALFDPAPVARLAEVAARETLLAFDLDGVLAPTVADPSAAYIPNPTRDLLAEVARRYPCVVLSGRSRDDLMPRVAGLPLREVIDNHGLDPHWRSADVAARVRGWKAELAGAIGPLAGVELEDKVFSLSIHWRRAEDPTEVAAAVRAAGALEGARVYRGKQVLNVLPDGAPDKGKAVIEALRRTGCAVAVYVGDDSTDEDVFRLASTGQVVGVRVGLAADSAASMYLRHQGEIDRLLQLLLALRAPSTR